MGLKTLEWISEKSKFVVGAYKKSTPPEDAAYRQTEFSGGVLILGFSSKSKLVITPGREKWCSNQGLDCVQKQTILRVN